MCQTNGASQLALSGKESNVVRQVLRAGALGRPRGMGQRGRQERGLGWGTHINPWLIHINVWQKPLQKKKHKKTQCRKHKRCSFNPWLGRSPGGGHGSPLQHPCLLDRPIGQRRLVNYSPWGHKGSDTTEVTQHTYMHQKNGDWYERHKIRAGKGS